MKLEYCHCVKSVHVRSFSGSTFPAFGLNTERYSVSLRIQSECEKIRILTLTIPNTDTFYAVCCFEVMPLLEKYLKSLANVKNN